MEGVPIRWPHYPAAWCVGGPFVAPLRPLSGSTDQLRTQLLAVRCSRRGARDGHCPRRNAMTLRRGPPAECPSSPQWVRDRAADRYAEEIANVCRAALRRASDCRYARNPRVSWTGFRCPRCPSSRTGRTGRASVQRLRFLLKLRKQLKWYCLDLGTRNAKNQRVSNMIVVKTRDGEVAGADCERLHALNISLIWYQVWNETGAHYSTV